MSTIKQEAQRCLKCKKPQCAMHCPVETPVPQVMELFLNGQTKEAGEMLFRNNPLTAVTAIVCPHERNCTGHCVLGNKGEPVEFFRIEQYISRFYLETFEAPEIQKNGIKIAVVGGGPAGIAMSMMAALKGYEVTLFEAQDNLGGVLRYGIPAFRLPKDILDMYKDILLSLGVHFRPNTRLGASIGLKDLFPDGYKAVFIAAGTGRPNRLGLLGETLGHVHFAIDYLKSPENFQLGRRVAIIGAGNVAIDAARTVIRREHSHAMIINYKGAEEMPANHEEIELAELDGVEFMHYAQAVRILDDAVRCVRVNRVELEDGNVVYEEDFADTFDVPIDSVILAIGQGPGADVNSSVLEVTKKGLIIVDEWGETNLNGVFAAGDIVTGPRTVVEAIASTKKAFQRMDEYLQQG
ncbi:MAG: NAD(P)-dependent oxidoreductase [Oscillospiraceae bacterium]|nr:NAD(P)-dependent oxidoreductase [Oscillospiraceae bacterium]